MKERTKYTEAFRKQALEKVHARGNRTVEAVAEGLNVNLWPLKNWMKSHNAQYTHRVLPFFQK